MKLSKLIKEQREKHNLTQNELGIKLGYMNGQYISNVERELCMFSLKKTKRLATLFNLNPLELREMWIQDFLHRIRGNK